MAGSSIPCVGMVSGTFHQPSPSFICAKAAIYLHVLSREPQAVDGQCRSGNLYPGQIFKAKVKSIWKANGDGQLLPSGTLPKFEPRPPTVPQNQYAVAIVFDDADQSKFPIGAEGEAAIYTSGMTGSWAALRRIGIRTTSWFNFIYPVPF